MTKLKDWKPSDDPADPICPLCTKPITVAQIQSGGQEVQEFKGKLVHADCYYGENDGSPIVSARVRRG